MAAMKLAGTEKRRSTEQKNTVTMGVTATQDSTSEWRELGAQVRQHYERLGFSADVIDNFMMTKRDDIELFFSLNPEHDPKRTASCIYVRVADAEALHALWQAASIPGLRQLRNTNYKMREFAYV